MPMNDFDAGRLIEQVAQLTRSVEALTSKVSALETQANFGKGAFWGIMLVAGGLGGVLTWFIQRLFGGH